MYIGYRLPVPVLVVVHEPVPTRVETSTRFPYLEAMTTSSLEFRAIEAHFPILPEVDTFSIDQEPFSLVA